MLYILCRRLGVRGCAVAPKINLRPRDYPPRPPDEQGAGLPPSLRPSHHSTDREAFVCLLTLFPSLPPLPSHPNPSFPQTTTPPTTTSQSTPTRNSSCSRGANFTTYRLAPKKRAYSPVYLRCIQCIVEYMTLDAPKINKRLGSFMWTALIAMTISYSPRMETDQGVRPRLGLLRFLCSTILPSCPAASAKFTSAQSESGSRILEIQFNKTQSQLT